MVFCKDEKHLEFHPVLKDGAFPSQFAESLTVSVLSVPLAAPVTVLGVFPAASKSVRIHAPLELAASVIAPLPPVAAHHSVGVAVPAKRTLLVWIVAAYFACSFVPIEINRSKVGVEMAAHGNTRRREQSNQQQHAQNNPHVFRTHSPLLTVA